MCARMGRVRIRMAWQAQKSLGAGVDPLRVSGAVPFLHQGLFWKGFLSVPRHVRAEKVTALKTPVEMAWYGFYMVQWGPRCLNFTSSPWPLALWSDSVIWPSLCRCLLLFFFFLRFSFLVFGGFLKKVFLGNGFVVTKSYTTQFIHLQCIQLSASEHHHHRGQCHSF